MDMELEGKVAIVTGAAGGFGRALVRALLGAGAKVAALDVNEKRLDDLAATHAEASGVGRLVTARTDIARYEECEAAIAHTRERLGGLHILVNNGALGDGCHPHRPHDRARRDPRDCARRCGTGSSP